MPNKFFPPELRTASIVPRWSVVHTIQRDVISNHSFFVTFYARQIAKIIGWAGSMEDLMVYAMYHDLDELVTGDIVSPIKKAIVDADRAKTFVSGKMRASMPSILYEIERIETEIYRPDDIKHIVKAADRLDALLFLIIEQRLGNTIVERRIADCEELFLQAWLDLPTTSSRDPMTKATLGVLYNTVVRPEISWHKDLGGFGV